MAFNVGDKVKIRVGSRYYGSAYNNPKDVVGVIGHIHTSIVGGFHNIRVDWPVSIHNVYEEHDLEAADAPVVVTKEHLEAEGASVEPEHPDHIVYLTPDKKKWAHRSTRVISIKGAIYKKDIDKTILALAYLKQHM